VILPLHIRTARRRALTMLELLVVLAIIGLLATLAVPAYLNHLDQARKTAAYTEAKQLAEALQACGFRHGFFVPLQVLDDVAPADDALDYDDLGNSERAFGDIFLIDVGVPLDDQTASQSRLSWRLSGVDFKQRIRDLYEAWNGPFITIKRNWAGQDSRQVDLNQALSDATRARDWPLDPWGNPYRLYSPLGIVGTDAHWDLRDPASYYAALDSTSFGDGRLLTGPGPNEGFYQLDQYAVVSYGPDGVEGTITLAAGSAAIADNRNDDILYLFGAVPNDFTYRIY